MINEIPTNTVICGDVLETMKGFPNNAIDCIMTSPPYYHLRDYGFPGQWGLEKTYQEYLDKMIYFMAECKRVIKPTGSIWINLGDSYSTNSGSMKQNKIKYTGAIDGYGKEANNFPDKSLMLIPHRFAIRCVDELGLALRNDIIWAKPNAMPESVTDRFSKKHEFIFFFVKSKNYYFDLDSTREKCVNAYGKNPGDVADFWNITTKGSSEKHYATFNSELIDKPIIAGCPEFVCNKCGEARKKIVKTKSIPTRPNISSKYDNIKSAPLNGKSHSAKVRNMPVKISETVIDCGCNAGFSGGIILDPFAGTGTTLIRASELGRNVIGIEGNKEYHKIASDWLNKQLLQEKLF